MKTKLLTLLLSAFSYCTMFGQSITGEMNPCPNVDYTYQITLPDTMSVPSITGPTNGQLVSSTFTSNLSQITYKYVIRWFNFYQTQNGAPVKSTFDLKSGRIGKPQDKSYSLAVTIKGLSDIQFSSVPTISCAYRGNITVSVTPVANATKYVWTNSAGWGGNITTTTASNVFNVTNESQATITVVAYNDGCAASNPVVSKTNSTTITRPAVTTKPAFTATSPKEVCPGASVTADVTVTEGTPVSYEWYTLPAGYIAINGGSYGASAPLSTTSPGVTLSYIGPATGGQPTMLYCRAIYSATCKTDYSYYTLSTGKPTVNMFHANTTSMGDVYGDSFGACPSEVLQIFPVTNYDNTSILEHTWEVLSGSYSSVSNLTGVPIRLRMSSRLDAEVEFRYRFRTPCGWSEWLNCYAFTWDCSGVAARTTVITEKTTATAANPVSFTISPNPATNEIAVNIPDAKANTDLFLNISDIKGVSLIRRKQQATSRVTVDISKLPAGQYILQVQSGIHNYSKQFIVAK